MKALNRNFTISLDIKHTSSDESNVHVKLDHQGSFYIIRTIVLLFYIIFTELILFLKMILILKI